MRYEINGIKDTYREWLNGKKNGEWVYFNLEGKVYITEKYSNGKLMSKKVWID